MDNKKKEKSPSKGINIDFKNLEKLILISTKEVIEQDSYMEILKDKVSPKEVQTTKTYKLR